MNRQERIAAAYHARATGMSSDDTEAATWLEDTEVMEALFSFFNGAYYTVHTVTPQLVADAEALIRARRTPTLKDTTDAQDS